MGGWTDHQLMQYLVDDQEEQFKKIGVVPGHLFSDVKKTRFKRNRLNLMAIENCLCEIYKYLKAVDGTGRPRNRYPGFGEGCAPLPVKTKRKKKSRPVTKRPALKTKERVKTKAKVKVKKKGVKRKQHPVPVPALEPLPEPVRKSMRLSSKTRVR